MDSAAGTTVRILCTNGLKSVFAALDDDLRATSGADFAADFGSTKKFTDRIAGGDVPDLAILTDEAVDALIAQGRLAGRRIDVAKSFIGVAVRQGAPRPDIATPEAFVRTLKSAKSIARSRLGASGVHMASLIDRLGLAEELADKIHVYDGYAGQACANGEVEIAIQQISELMPVDGLDIVGPLPGDLQKVTMFSAGIGASTRHRAAVEALVASLRSEGHASVLRAKGLEPA
ncbi:MAG TPA: substrate-binding domain-containing protein [Xanthobacteraceae bacterium]|nr:substrate-binding domain-containing protein [Xanthobacteraceae bacterium]